MLFLMEYEDYLRWTAPPLCPQKSQGTLSLQWSRGFSRLQLLYLFWWSLSALSGLVFA